MISQAMEYSLRAMILLAQNQNRPLTVQFLADQGKIPAPYLAKLLQGLTRGRLVASQRGVGGGFVLARGGDQITLADIASVIDPLQRITKCPLGISGHTALCPLHKKLDQALATIEQAFRETTLEDLLKENSGSTPLCRADRATVVELK